jgi:hypothetical protein
MSWRRLPLLAATLLLVLSAVTASSISASAAALGLVTATVLGAPAAAGTAAVAYVIR